MTGWRIREETYLVYRPGMTNFEFLRRFYLGLL